MYELEKGWFNRKGENKDLLITECALYFFHIAQALETGATNFHMSFTSGSDNLRLYQDAIWKCKLFRFRKDVLPDQREQLVFTLYGMWMLFVHKTNEFKAMDLMKAKLLTT